jgi:hypothetical protein
MGCFGLNATASISGDHCYYPPPPVVAGQLSGRMMAAASFASLACARSVNSDGLCIVGVVTDVYSSAQAKPQDVKSWPSMSDVIYLSDARIQACCVAAASAGDFRHMQHIRCNSAHRPLLVRPALGMSVNGLVDSSMSSLRCCHSPALAPVRHNKPPNRQPICCSGKHNVEAPQSAPLLDAVLERGNRLQDKPFHVPGHKVRM